MTLRDAAERPPERIVLDTNVVLDCTMFEDPGVAPIVAMLERGDAVALVRDDSLDELVRVLAYPRFALDGAAQSAALARYLRWTERVTGTPVAAPLPACRDRDDQKFLEIARDGGARWLLSKDKALLVLGRRRTRRTPFEITTPARFADDIRAGRIARTNPSTGDRNEDRTAPGEMT